MFIHTITGKLGVEEVPLIGGFVNPKIQERYNLIPKTSPVY